MKVDFKIKTKMGIFTQVTKIKGQFQKKKLKQSKSAMK